MTGAAPLDPVSLHHSSSRIDAVLVRRGLARSRGHAARLLAGGMVVVDGRQISKASTVITDASHVVVRDTGTEPDYVSRAAFKLRGALDALGDAGPNVDGADCLDVGASTGGFTQVLLERGAARVIALDVGHDQLAPRVREDARVHVIEGFNARSLAAGDLPWRPRLVVADVSFISLTLVLPPVLSTVTDGADLLVMVKPQFEVGRERLGSGGVVRDPALHAQAIRDVVASTQAAGAIARAVIPSSLPGPHGNREFFVWFTRAEPRTDSIDDTIERAVRDASDGSVPDAHRVSPNPPRTGGRP